MKLNRLSLNVVGLNRIGLNQIGSPSRGSSSGTDRPYIDPEVLASLKAVCICYGKSNDDPDRAVVKNLVDPDNPFVISNAAYTEGSGYADKDSPYYGAFVTDGIDDLITSTKTVQEMLGGSNEITVVSMAHFIKGESNAPEICRINQIRRDTRSIRNSISKIGKSGIFGYTYKNGVTTINNILGNKNDCTAEGNLDGIVAPFSVEGYYYNNNSNPLELCSIAWYWTIIANKVLITDQINQVIAYFNLDRTLKPDILCNTIKQGITNENHAEFGDKLIDFSGNGRDIQLNNIAWNKESGIGDDDESYGVNVIADKGTIDSTEITSFYGAWNTVLNWLIINRPFAHIGIIVSNGLGRDEYRQAEIEIANKWGIPYIDLNGDERTPMMLRSTNPTICDAAKNARLNAQRISSTNQHPNSEAYEYESTFIEQFLRTL